ncbi:MAG: tryptophan 7-halogenase [Bacteroidetes bacterium]|nr:tryptophan 7-halogenase [Bacteroidota bacterium]
MKTKVDVLVIGAGPSGTIAAAILHKAGLSVQVVEKMKFPRFVIGESLLPRCMEALEEAELLDAVLKNKFQRKTGAKFVWGEKICDFKFSQQYTKGWDHAYQVQRADFDKALADACQEKGIDIAYETEVIDVKIQTGGTSVTTVKTKEGATHLIHAKFIVDGSGYGRVLPTLFGLNKASTQYTRKAVFAHIEDPHRHETDEPDEPDRITICVHNLNTWIWVIPFSTGTTSLGFVGSPDFFDGFSGSLSEQYQQMIASEKTFKNRFRDLKLIWNEPRILQGWSTTTDTFFGNGFVLTGNVTEFLDPVFSSGVTLAAVSAQKAAHLVIKHFKGEPVDWQNEYVKYMQTGIDVFRTFVNRWYDGTLFKIFFAKNPNEDVQNKICSVLAGYVWDDTNPFVVKSDKTVCAFAKYIELEKQ